MGRLILHLGTHKTGSSAVQSWLLQNAKNLEKADIVFPVAFVGPAGNGADLARAIVMTADRQGNVPLQLRQNFLAFCKQNAGKDVIVSAEEFENSLLPSVKRAGGSGKARKEESLRAVLSGNLENVSAFACEAGFSSVKIVYLLRNIVDRASSAFAQRVKAIIHWHFDAKFFDPKTAAYHDRAACNRLMEEAGFEIAIDVLDPKAASVVDQVMRLAGLSDRVAGVASFETPRVNESIGHLGVLAGLHLADVIRRGPHEDMVRRRRAMSQALKKACDSVRDSPFNGFTPEDAKLVSQKQAELNEKLSPWLAADRIAMIAEPKRLAPRSPTSIDELNDGDVEVVRSILQRVADIMCSPPDSRFGYLRTEIMAIGELPPSTGSVEQTVSGNNLNKLSTPRKRESAAAALRKRKPLEQRRPRKRHVNRIDVAGSEGTTYPEG